MCPRVEFFFGINLSFSDPRRLTITPKMKVLFEEIIVEKNAACKSKSQLALRRPQNWKPDPEAKRPKNLVLDHRVQLEECDQLGEERAWIYIGQKRQPGWNFHVQNQRVRWLEGQTCAGWKLGNPDPVEDPERTPWSEERLNVPLEEGEGKSNERREVDLQSASRVTSFFVLPHCSASLLLSIWTRC